MSNQEFVLMLNISILNYKIIEIYNLDWEYESKEKIIDILVKPNIK